MIRSNLLFNAVEETRVCIDKRDAGIVCHYAYSTGSVRYIKENSVRLVDLFTTIIFFIESISNRTPLYGRSFETGKRESAINVDNNRFSKSKQKILFGLRANFLYSSYSAMIESRGTTGPLCRPYGRFAKNAGRLRRASVRARAHPALQLAFSREMPR